MLYHLLLTGKIFFLVVEGGGGLNVGPGFFLGGGGCFKPKGFS